MLEFTDLFTQSPGDFFYHVLVILGLTTGLVIAYGQRAKHPQSHTGTIYGAALLAALASWMLIVGGVIFARFNGQPLNSILPPLERAVNISTMMLITWAFLVADDREWGNRPTITLLMGITLTTLAYTFTGVQWIQIASTADFNLSQFGVFWGFAEVLVAVSGAVFMLVFFRNVIDAPLKFVFFLILIFGYGATLYQMATGNIIGNYSSFARLGLFAAIPIVPYVVYRKVIYGYELAVQMQSNAHTPMVTPRRTVEPSTSVVAQPLSDSQVAPSSSPVERESVQLLRTLGLILEEAEPSQIPTRIVQASIEVLKADVGALLSIEDANYADITVAYDRVMRRPIPAMLSLNLEQQHTLANAIDRRQQRPLFVDRNLEELEDLYSRLDVPQIGPAYFQPLMKDDEIIAVLVVGLPFGKRELRDAERELLKGIGIISGSLLSLSYAADTAKTRAEERAIQAMVTGVPLDEITDADILKLQQEMKDSLEAAKVQNQSLQKQVAQLKIRLDDERTRLTHILGDTQEGLSVTQRIIALNDEQDKLRYERDQLAQRLQEAETALAGATGTDEDAVFRSQIETLDREKRELIAELNALRGQLEELESIGAQPQPEKAADVIETMARERERLLADRENLNVRLEDVRDQLEALGIDGENMGLTQLVQQLYDQRSKLQARTQALKMERDALLNERRRFEQRIRKEEERETQIETMESEIRHLATDREAITRQRDAFRQERNQLQEKVDKVKMQRARLLADVTVYQDDLRVVQEQLEQVQQDFETLSADYRRTESERDELRAEYRAAVGERDQLLARVEGNRERLQKISDDAHRELREMIRDITTQRNQLLEELNQTRSQLQRSGGTAQPASPVVASGSTNGHSANPELLMSMVDSLRTPMTSVVGYIDLLVSESAGLLSEMQRKFIQRISANIVRLETMLNDLSHMTALDTGAYQLHLRPVNIVEIIEDAITNATYQFREKDLTLHIDLDDTLPQTNLDSTSVNQVIGQLLTNAYLVSSTGSTVGVTTGQTTQNNESYIQISISDSGGGIPEDEQSEVFARRYRTEHQLLQGIGDTGVGLSIAKALVEAHGGELWFETNLGEGTTFHFTLPTDLAATEAA